MVARTLAPILLGLTLALSARADLSLVPKSVAFRGEGMTFHHLVFSDGSGKEITYRQPPGWEVSGSASKLTLHPPHKPQAEGTIMAVSLARPWTFDEQGLKDLVGQTLAAVPAASTELQLVSQERNPVKIGGRETFLVIVSYALYGDRYSRSFMFMNRGNEHLRFEFVSRVADFEDLQRAFLASQFSWHNL